MLWKENFLPFQSSDRLGLKFYFLLLPYSYCNQLCCGGTFYLMPLSQLKFVSWNLKTLSFDPTVICYSSFNRQSVNKHYLFLNHPSRGGWIDMMFLLPAEVLFHLSLGFSSLHWVLKDVCQSGHVRDQEPRWLIPNGAETNWYQQAAEIVTSCKTRGHDLRLKGVVAEGQLKQSVFIQEKIQIQSKATRNCKIHIGSYELGRRKKAYFKNRIIIMGKSVNFVQIRVKPQNHKGD